MFVHTEPGQRRAPSFAAGRPREIAVGFRLEDVWALPTPGGPDDFPRLVHLIAAGGLA
jgi:hypothetical protein